MQPRYRPTFLSDYHYLGGYDRFDLYLDNDNDLRVVWGNTDTHWHFVSRGQRTFTLSFFHEFNDLVDAPTTQEMLYIKRYLKTFAPDAWAALAIGGKKCRENTNPSSENS